MKVKASGDSTDSAFEYFLYAIVILEAAVAAFAFKAISQFAQVSQTARVYLLALYFGVLVWVFFQLDRLHRKRKKALAQGGQMPPDQVRVGPAGSGAPDEVTATAVPAGAAVEVIEPAPSALLFGLGWGQIVVIIFVFLIALRVFGWMMARVLKP